MARGELRIEEIRRLGADFHARSLALFLPQVSPFLSHPLLSLALMSDTAAAPVAASVAVPEIVEGMEKLAVEGEEPEEEGLTLRALVSSKEAGQSGSPCRSFARSRCVLANLHPFRPRADIFSIAPAGVIIGRGGATIATMRSETNVKAGVSKVVPGIADRILSVGGSVEGVAQVRRTA